LIAVMIPDQMELRLPDTGVHEGRLPALLFMSYDSTNRGNSMCTEMT